MKRVLLVDDEEDVRLLLRLALNRRDWTVDEASSGQEALERCGTNTYDAIVLDQRMPRMTGIEVAQQLRDDGIETPIVLFSAFLDPAVEAQAREVGLIAIPKDDLQRLVDALPSDPAAE